MAINLLYLKLRFSENATNIGWNVHIVRIYEFSRKYLLKFWVSIRFFSTVIILPLYVIIVDFNMSDTFWKIMVAFSVDCESSCQITTSISRLVLLFLVALQIWCKEPRAHFLKNLMMQSISLRKGPIRFQYQSHNFFWGLHKVFVFKIFELNTNLKKNINIFNIFQQIWFRGPF